MQTGDDAGQVAAAMTGMHQRVHEVAVAVMVFGGNPGFMLADIMQMACFGLSCFMQVAQ